MPANVWTCAFWKKPVEKPVAVTGKGPRLDPAEPLGQRHRRLPQPVGRAAFWAYTKRAHPRIRGWARLLSAGPALHLHLPAGSGASFLGPPTRGQLPGVRAAAA